ncbi:hypothetical protein BDW72DRAFT_722 [Aspergillus terricola var. indicus]
MSSTLLNLMNCLSPAADYQPAVNGFTNTKLKLELTGIAVSEIPPRIPQRAKRPPSASQRHPTASTGKPDCHSTPSTMANFPVSGRSAMILKDGHFRNRSLSAWHAEPRYSPGREHSARIQFEGNIAISAPSYQIS